MKAIRISIKYEETFWRICISIFKKRKKEKDALTENMHKVPLQY